MNADLAFQQTANLAAAYAATPPAYVSYISRTTIRIPRLRRERDFAYHEISRTLDGETTLIALPQGKHQTVAQGFPLLPTFNAISGFNLRYGMSWHGMPSFQLSNVAPLTFAPIVPHDVDVVVVSTKGYHIRFAPDSSDAKQGTTHVFCTPTQHELSIAPRNAYFFSEVLIDNASGLPLRVSYVGNSDFKLDFVYGFPEGRWALQSAHLESTLYGPLHIGRLHFVADTTFSETHFSATAPLEFDSR